MKLFTTDKEEAIVRKLSKGDATAIDLLYATYAPHLTAVCARYIPRKDDMKDVLQEAFIKMFSNASGFNYRGKGSLKAWATRIVINESLLFLRRIATSGMVFTDKDLPDQTDETPDVSTLNAEEITAMIGRLPPGYRMVFNLYVVEGMSHQQISELLGIKVDTSASQLHKAKAMLARMIKEHRKQQEQRV